VISQFEGDFFCFYIAQPRRWLIGPQPIFKPIALLSVRDGKHCEDRINFRVGLIARLDCRVVGFGFNSAGNL
jgi:hypothetical protein